MNRSKRWTWLGAFFISAITALAGCATHPAEPQSAVMTKSLVMADVGGKEPPKVVTITRVYDVRDFLIDIPNFDGAPDFLVPSPPPPPNFTGSTVAGRTKEQLVEDLVRLIQETIAPGEWIDSGGTIGVIKELSANLIINHTEDVHRQIAALFSEFRKSLSTVRIRAHWVLCDRAAFEPFLHAAPLHTLVPDKASAEALYAISPSDLDHLPGAILHLKAEQVCIDGQRTYISDLQWEARPVRVSGPATESTDLDQRPQTAEGVVLDVQPTFNFDRQEAYLQIRSDLSMTRTPPPAPSPSTQPSSAEPNTHVHNAERRTTVCIPAGKMVLISGAPFGFAHQPTIKPANADSAQTPPQLYLFIEVTRSGRN